MASRIVNHAIGMRLEIQLINGNSWLASNFSNKSKSNASPVAYLLEMLTEGSPGVDAVLLRETCPYLFKIWSQPLFKGEYKNGDVVERSSQHDSLLLSAFDETILGVIFSYLSEEDLSHSVSSVCFIFRASIASRKHIEALLGPAVSTQISELFARAKVNTRDSAQTLSDRLIELATTMSEAKLAYDSMDVDMVLDSNNNSQTRVDAALTAIFQTVPDCSKRLVQLATGLTAKRALQAERAKIMSILRAIRRVQHSSELAHQSLLHLLGSALSFGWTFGTTKGKHMMSAMLLNDEAVEQRFQGFQFACLKDLQTIESRFNKPFTPMVAILLHVLEKSEMASIMPGRFEQGIKELDAALFVLCGENTGSVFQIMDSARSIVNKIRRVARDARDLASISPFHSRILHLFELLEPSCRELDQIIAIAGEELSGLTSWLVPMRVDHEEQSIFVKIHGTNGELKCLADFVHHCNQLLALPQSEGCKAMRELAVTVTALEQSAVAKSASQKALSRRSSSPPAPVSSEFTSARAMVGRVLDQSQRIAVEKDQRMNQMMREVISEEEHERRRNQLASLLQFRSPAVAQVSYASVEGHQEEQQVNEAEESPNQGDRTASQGLPLSVAAQIKALRSDAAGVETETANGEEEEEEQLPPSPMEVEQQEQEQDEHEKIDQQTEHEEEELQSEIVEEATAIKTTTTTTVAKETPSSIIATSPPRSFDVVNMVGAAISASMTMTTGFSGGGGLSPMTTPSTAQWQSQTDVRNAGVKSWNWHCFSTEQVFNVWRDLHNSNSIFLVPYHGEEESILLKLFSRGPEVASTVTTKFQRFKHFTSEDFYGAKTLASSTTVKRDQSALNTSLVDLDRTKRVVESLPQVQRVFGRPGGLSSSSPQPTLASTSARLVQQQPQQDQMDVVGEQSASSNNKHVESSNEDGPQLVLPFEKIVSLKKDGKLGTLGLKPHVLESYLADDDFERVFHMNRTQFHGMAGWKRDKLKKQVGLF